jgi:hypothetical protein
MCASMNWALSLNINNTNVVKVQFLKSARWRLWLGLSDWDWVGDGD